MKTLPTIDAEVAEEIASLTAELRAVLPIIQRVSQRFTPALRAVNQTARIHDGAETFHDLYVLAWGLLERGVGGTGPDLDHVATLEAKHLS